MTGKRSIVVVALTAFIATALPATAATNVLPAKVGPRARFGAGVAVAGSWAAVGAPGGGAGSVHIYKRVKGHWRFQQRVVAPDGRRGDLFGETVAMTGSALVVGAINDDRKGSAYFFRRAGSRWALVNKVVGSRRAVDDSFGNSVSIWKNRAVIGAWHHGGKAFYGTSHTGQAFVYEMKGGRWKQVARLVGSDSKAEDGFGTSVAVEDDTILVSAWHEDSRDWNAGAVYVFKRESGTWAEHSKFVGPDTVSTDHFGISVAISGDTFLIGAWDDDDRALNSGAAYVFVPTVNDDPLDLLVGAGPWFMQAKLTASDGGYKDLFGTSVAIDGDRAVIGAYGDDIKGNNSGSAYIFLRDSGTWSQSAHIVPPSAWPSAHLGTSVAIDGTRVLVGADLADVVGPDSGAVVTARAG